MWFGKSAAASEALHLAGPASQFFRDITFLGFETSRSLQPARQVNAVDGRPVDPLLFERTREELVVQFGAISLQPNVIQGTWVSEGICYEDKLLRLAIDVDNTDQNPTFFANFKNVLLERFEQVEIYIVSFGIDVI